MPPVEKNAIGSTSAQQYAYLGWSGLGDNFPQELTIRLANFRPGKSCCLVGPGLPAGSRRLSRQSNMSRYRRRIDGIEQELVVTHNPAQSRRVMADDRQPACQRLDVDVAKRFFFGKMQKDVGGLVQRWHPVGSKGQSRVLVRQQARRKLIAGLPERTVAGDNQVRIGYLADGLDPDFDPLRGN